MKIKRILIVGISIILGVFMLFAAYNHVAKPEAYSAMIPFFIPQQLAHLFAIITESCIGVFLILPKNRRYAALAMCLLMICFLPLHIWDLFRENHAENILIPTMQIAIIRFIIQILVIVATFFLHKALAKLEK